MRLPLHVFRLELHLHRLLGDRPSLRRRPSPVSAGSGSGARGGTPSSLDASAGRRFSSRSHATTPTAPGRTRAPDGVSMICTTRGCLPPRGTLHELVVISVVGDRRFHVSRSGGPPPSESAKPTVRDLRWADPDGSSRPAPGGGSNASAATSSGRGFGDPPAQVEARRADEIPGKLRENCDIIAWASLHRRTSAQSPAAGGSGPPS
jgi:hypothetical protein